MPFPKYRSAGVPALHQVGRQACPGERVLMRTQDRSTSVCKRCIVVGGETYGLAGFEKPGRVSFKSTYNGERVRCLYPKDGPVVLDPFDPPDESKAVTDTPNAGSSRAEVYVTVASNTSEPPSPNAGATPAAATVRTMRNPL